MSAEDLNLSAPLREALIGAADIADLLATWEGEPGVFTRRPAPEGAAYPMAMISQDITVGDLDFLNSEKPIVTRDIAFYGRVGAPGSSTDQTRDVEKLGYRARALFHGQRFAITVPGHHVVEIRVRGPFSAPTEDEKLVGRAISLTVHLQRLA